MVSITNITSNTFFMNLYKDLKSIMKKNDITEIKIKRIDESATKYLDENDFMSKKMEIYIMNHLKNCYEYTYQNNKIIILFCIK